LGLLVLSGRSFHLLVAVGIAASFVLFLSAEALIVILLVAHFSLFYAVDQFHLPSRLLWVPEGIIGLLFIKALVREGGGYSRTETWVFRIVLLLVFFSFLSVVTNALTPVTVAAGSRLWFRYPLMWWALSRVSVRPGFRKFVVMLFLGLVFLQVPATAFLKFFGAASKVSTGDTAGGTLGGASTHDLGLLCAMAICLLIGLYRETRDKRLLFLTPLLFLPAAIAEAKAFFVFTPIVCIYLLRRDLLQNPRVAFGWTVAIVVFLTGSIIVYNSIYTYREKDRIRLYESRTRETLQELLFNPQKMLASELNVTAIREDKNSNRKEMVVGRLAMVILAHDMVSTDWLTTIFGKGIGSFTENSFRDNNEREKGHVQLRAKNLIESAILELGYGGLMLVMMLLMAVYLNNRENKDHYDDPFWRGIAYGFQGVILLMALCSQYVGSFLHGTHTTFIFWLLLALLSSAGTRTAQEEQKIVRTQ
jgi:hypothetical protein